MSLKKRKIGDTYKATATVSDELTVNLLGHFINYYVDKIERYIKQMKGIEYEGDDTLHQTCVPETNFTKQRLMLSYSACTVASLKELKSKLNTFH